MATTKQPQPVSAGKGYSYQYKTNPDGSPGVDYFYNGLPTDREQFSQFTGTDPSQVEAGAGGYNPFQSAVGNFSASSPSLAQQYTPPVTFLGRTYDVSNPDQASAYRDAQIQNLAAQRDQTLGQVDQSLTQNLGDAAGQNALALGTYNQNAEDYARQLAGNVQSLGQGYDLGQVNSRQAFAGLGANAYQSGQGTSAQFADRQYQQGLSDLSHQADETVGLGYLQGQGIGSNSQLGRQVGALNSGYDAYLRNAQQQAQQAKQQANASYGSGVDQATSGLQAAYSAAGLQLPQFSTQAYNPFSMPSVNLSQYTPYTSASQLQGIQGSQGVGSGSNPFKASGNQYINQFLNRTPSQAA